MKDLIQKCKMSVYACVTLEHMVCNKHWVTIHITSALQYYVIKLIIQGHPWNQCSNKIWPCFCMTSCLMILTIYRMWTSLICLLVWDWSPPNLVICYVEVMVALLVCILVYVCNIYVNKKWEAPSKNEPYDNYHDHNVKKTNVHCFDLLKHRLMKTDIVLNDMLLVLF